MITSNWEIEQFNDGTDARVRAIKAFRIQESKIRLLEFYRPILGHPI
jgi:hypothetical protein